jgi:hypothetical protein
MRGARAGVGAGCGGRRWDGEPVSFYTTSRKSDLSMLYTGGWGGGWSAGMEEAGGEVPLRIRALHHPICREYISLSTY